jgi:Tfp pilus assembly protein PilO
MNGLSLDTRRAIVVVLAGLALVAALWVAVIGPKRSDSAAARHHADTQQQRLDTARTQLARYRTDKARFAGLRADMRRLDRAVPARGDVSGLLRELQAASRLRGAQLRLVALKDGGSTSTPPSPTTGTPDPSKTKATPTPGASPGPDGLSTLPFSLSFTGRYFDLVHLLRTVRRAVSEKDGDITARGRLLTIDGLSFQRPEPGSRITRASLNATAYVAPDPDAPLAAPATAAPTAPGAP